MDLGTLSTDSFPKLVSWVFKILQKVGSSVSISHLPVLWFLLKREFTNSVFTLRLPFCQTSTTCLGKALLFSDSLNLEAAYLFLVAFPSGSTHSSSSLGCSSSPCSSPSSASSIWSSSPGFSAFGFFKPSRHFTSLSAMVSAFTLAVLLAGLFKTFESLLLLPFSVSFSFSGALDFFFGEALALPLASALALALAVALALALALALAVALALGGAEAFALAVVFPAGFFIDASSGSSDGASEGWILSSSSFTSLSGILFSSSAGSSMTKGEAGKYLLVLLGGVTNPNIGSL